MGMDQMSTTTSHDNAKFPSNPQQFKPSAEHGWTSGVLWAYSGKAPHTPARKRYVYKEASEQVHCETLHGEVGLTMATCEESDEGVLGV